MKLGKRYIYYKGYKIKNNYIKEVFYIQERYIESVKSFIDKNINKLNKYFNKNRVIYTSGMVYNTNVDDLVQNDMFLTEIKDFYRLKNDYIIKNNLEKTIKENGNILKYIGDNRYKLGNNKIIEVDRKYILEKNKN